MSNSEDEVMIQPEPKKVKLKNSELIDLLSNLPDGVILHILSLMNIKDAVKTCILSVRWKDLWKGALIFHMLNFSSIKKFTKFVNKVLSHHDSSSALRCVDFDNSGPFSRLHLMQRVVNYAISHNVQQLGLMVKCKIAQIPLTLFSSKTLTHLKLFIFNQDIDITQFSLNLPALTHLELILSLHPCRAKIPFPKSFNLPSLTNLHLKDFAFCAGDNGLAEPFSAFTRLNSLFLESFHVRNTLTLCISSATLVNLNLHDISKNYFEIQFLTPSLVTFAFTGKPYQKIFGCGLSNVKHVDIDAKVCSLEEIKPFFVTTKLVVRI